jgi:hypothetical protein
MRVAKELEKFTDLQILDVSCSVLSYRTMYCIGHKLRFLKNIREIRLSKIDGFDMEIFPESLKCLEHLETLNMNDNSLGRFIYKILESINPASFKKLCIKNTALNDRNIIDVSNSLKRLTSLEYLDMSENNLKADGWKPFIAALRNLKSLITLHLYDNRIPDDYLIDLGQAITSLCSLRRFSEPNHQCRGEPSRYFSDSILYHVSIKFGRLSSKIDKKDIILATRLIYICQKRGKEKISGFTLVKMVKAVFVSRYLFLKELLKKLRET